MRNKWCRWFFVGCTGLLVILVPAFAGDSFSGKVTEVRSAEIVVIDPGTGPIVVHIIGIDAVNQSRAEQAKDYISKLLLGKRARLRFVNRAPNGEMLGRLFTDEPDGPIKDVGLELVRLGLARRKPGDEFRFSYKYGELSAAEREGQRVKTGIWSEAQPQQ
jgi:endonuclease YncB( thermonuclease family)